MRGFKIAHGCLMIVGKKKNFVRRYTQMNADEKKNKDGEGIEHEETEEAEKKKPRNFTADGR